MVLLKVTKKDDKSYKSVRISNKSYEAIKKLLHKKEFNSIIETIDYLVDKENI